MNTRKSLMRSGLKLNGVQESRRCKESRNKKHSKRASPVALDCARQVT